MVVTLLLLFGVVRVVQWITMDGEQGQIQRGGRGGFTISAPYPHVVYRSPHKPPQRKFWHSEEEEEEEERKKKGKREERRKKKKMSSPWSKLGLRP